MSEISKSSDFLVEAGTKWSELGIFSAFSMEPVVLRSYSKFLLLQFLSPINLTFIPGSFQTDLPGYVPWCILLDNSFIYLSCLLI